MRKLAGVTVIDTTGRAAADVAAETSRCGRWVALRPRGAEAGTERVTEPA